MQKDLELDSILQEARDSYKKRIGESKSYKNPHSFQEKYQKSDFEKLSPFKNTISDSLKYSTTFRHSNTEGKPIFKNRKSEEPSLGSRVLQSVLESSKNKKDLIEEVKQLKRELANTDEKLQMLKKSYKETENSNSELRNRVKDVTVCLNAVSEENSRLKELMNESNIRDLLNIKIHYKKKIAWMKKELVDRDNENQKIRKEIENQSRLRTSIRQVCETQVKEISEEYAKSLKEAGTVHNQEILRLKTSFDNMTETQVEEFLAEMEQMKRALFEYEGANKVYQEKFQRMVIAKEKGDKELIEKEQLLSQTLLTVQHLRKEVEKYQNSILAIEKCVKDKENQLCENQLLIQRLKNEFDQFLNTEASLKEREMSFESTIQQLTEESRKKQQCINKLIEELDRQERLIKKFKQDYELKLEEEKSKSYSNQLETSKLDSTNSDLLKTLDNLKYRNTLLEDQLNTQTTEFRKKQDLEMIKQDDRIKGLESELKSLYLENSVQAKEIENLRLLCGEIESTQERELKALAQKSEEQVREIKKIDRHEYLQLCEALEATKRSLHCAESNLDKYESVIKEMQSKEKGYLGVMRNVECYKRQAEEAVAQYHMLGLKYSKAQIKLQNAKELIVNKFKKMKDGYKVCIKNILDHLQEFKSFQQKSLSSMLKNLIFNVETLKKTQNSASQKLLTENHYLKSSLEKSLSQISHLERELQSYLTQNKLLSDQNNNLKRTLESNDPISQKSYFISIIKSFMSSLSALESSTNESYTELDSSIVYLKDFIIQDALKSRLMQESTLEQAKKSIDFYREKLIKLENEKAAEVHKSQTELFSLQQRLGQVLEDIRDQKF